MLLAQHVVCLHALYLALARAGIEQGLRTASVRMHAQTCGTTGNDDGIGATGFQRDAQGCTVQALAHQQAFGAPATLRIDVVLVLQQIHGFIRRERCVATQPHATRASFDEFGNAFQHVHEALCASIHHARTLQQGHLPGGIGQCAARADQGAGKTTSRIGL